MSNTSGYARLATQAVPRISTTQLVLGVITIIFGIPIIVVSHESSLGQHYSANGFIATTIWAGVYFIINGAFGLKAANSDTAENILTTLVLNSISLLFSGSLVGLSAYSAFGTNKHCPFSDYYIQPQDTYNYRTPSPRLNDQCVNRNALLALDTFLMLLGLCQFILAFVSIKFNKEALVLSEVRAADDDIRRDFVWFSYRQRKIFGCSGIIQVIMSIACIAFGIVVVATSHGRYFDQALGYSLNGYTGAGIWCGVIFLANSIYHLVLKNAEVKGPKVVASAGLSILGMILSIVLMAICALSIIDTNKPCTLKQTASERIETNDFFRRSECKNPNVLFALDTLTLFISLGQFICMLTYLILSSHALYASRHQTPDESGPSRSPRQNVVLTTINTSQRPGNQSSTAVSDQQRTLTLSEVQNRAYRALVVLLSGDIAPPQRCQAFISAYQALVVIQSEAEATIQQRVDASNDAYRALLVLQSEDLVPTPQTTDAFNDLYRVLLTKISRIVPTQQYIDQYNAALRAIMASESTNRHTEHAVRPTAPPPSNTHQSSTDAPPPSYDSLEESGALNV